MARHGLMLKFKTTALHHRVISRFHLLQNTVNQTCGVIPLETKRSVKLGKTYQASLLAQLTKYSEFYAMQEISGLSTFKI